MLPDDGAAGRRERARRGPQTPADVAGSSDQPGGSTGCRPTAAELAEALAVIRQMKAATPPILLGRGQPPKPNVVACAIAMQRGELFESEAAALQRFGVAACTQDASAPRVGGRRLPRPWRPLRGPERHPSVLDDRTRHPLHWVRVRRARLAFPAGLRGSRSKTYATCREW